jgi:hypothetical protein
MVPHGLVVGQVLANKKKEKDGEHLAAVTNDFLFLFLLEIVCQSFWIHQDKKVEDER